ICALAASILSAAKFFMALIPIKAPAAAATAPMVFPKEPNVLLSRLPSLFDFCRFLFMLFTFLLAFKKAVRTEESILAPSWNAISYVFWFAIRHRRLHFFCDFRQFIKRKAQIIVNTGKSGHRKTNTRLTQR